MRRVAILGVAALVAAVAATGARAAAPRYILVSGPGLTRPILLGDWDESLRFLAALLSARRVTSGLAHRPRYDLAL